ncbi:ATP9B isoform 13, partial [Pongo abelii]
CGNMAREGLRTLVVAKKALTEEQYQDFEVPQGGRGHREPGEGDGTAVPHRRGGPAADRRAAHAGDAAQRRDQDMDANRR